MTSFVVFEGPKVNQDEGPLVGLAEARFDRSGIDPPAPLLLVGRLGWSDKEGLDLFSPRGYEVEGREGRVGDGRVS